MYDPTMLTVAHSIQADRLTQAATRMRLAEGQTAGRADLRVGVPPLRGRIAQMLLALAAQIASPTHSVQAT